MQWKYKRYFYSGMRWRIDLNYMQYLNHEQKIFSIFRVGEGLCILVLSRTTKEIKIVMNNAAIYVSKMSQRATSNLNLEVHWLFQYSPTLAPVELIFRMLKRKLASMNSKVWIKFNKEASKKTITKWIRW